MADLMNLTPKVFCWALLTVAMVFLPGCLGDRYENNVPPANLGLWQDAQEADPYGPGRPRFIGDAGTLPRSSLPRGTVPGTRGSMPRRGSLPLRGSLPGRGSLPSRNVFPDRGSLPR